YFVTLYFAGALFGLPFTGRVLDRIGSRPILRTSLVVFAVVLGGWAALAGEIIAPSVWLIAALHLLTGYAGANFNLANVRITMATMPPMGRSHFFAFFTVIASLGLGVSPLVWGILLDALASTNTALGAWHWTPF